MLKQAMVCHYEADALLAKVGKIVRKEILNCAGFNFDITLSQGCQHHGSVPSTLKTLVSMLLNGADLRDQDSVE